VLVAVALAVIFGLLSPDFLSSSNIDNILMQISVVGTVAIGETIVMLLGGIDLSVGSVVLLSASVIGVLSATHGLTDWIAIPLGLAAATGVGLLNGIFVVGVGIEPIIVTLGTLVAVQGLGQMLLAANGSWIQVNDPLFLNIATGRVAAVPVMAVIMLALYAAGAIMLRRTPFGRAIYAAGGNRRAARLAGLPVGRTMLVAYALSGLCAGAAGVLEIAQLGIVSQNVGVGLQFSAITAVLVGGLGLAGGQGRLEKTLLGTLIVGAITNYLTFRGVSAYYEQAITGLILLAAVFADHLARRRSE
jgi:ribose transport system permease protein